MKAKVHQHGCFIFRLEDERVVHKHSEPTSALLEHLSAECLDHLLIELKSDLAEPPVGGQYLRVTCHRLIHREILSRTKNGNQSELTVKGIVIKVGGLKYLPPFASKKSGLVQLSPVHYGYERPCERRGQALMTNAMAEPFTNHMQALFGVGTCAGMNDAQLLRSSRWAAARPGNWLSKP